MTLQDQLSAAQNAANSDRLARQVAEGEKERVQSLLTADFQKQQGEQSQLQARSEAFKALEAQLAKEAEARKAAEGKIAAAEETSVKTEKSKQAVEMELAMAKRALEMEKKVR
jgi:pyruvate-formate lyase